MKFIKEVNIKIFHEILFHVRKTMNLKQFKAFYYWSLILSLDEKTRYIHGDVSLYGIDKTFFINNFGKYGYEIFNSMMDNETFFERIKGHDHNILRAKPVEKIISEFNLDKNALEYSTIKCDIGFMNFKNAIIQSLLGTMLKKEIAKLLNVSQQTISNILKNNIKVVKFVKKTWRIIKSINYDDLIFGLFDVLGKRYQDLFLRTELDLKYNDLIPEPIPI